MSDGTSLTIIAVCQIFLVLAWIGLVIGLIWGVLTLKKVINYKVEEILNKVQPLLDKADEVITKAQPVLEKTSAIAEQVRETAEIVGEKVDLIVSKAESTVETVSDKVRTVSTRVEESVTPQIAKAAGIAGTIAKFIELYRGINKTCSAAASQQQEKVSEDADRDQEAQTSI